MICSKSIWAGLLVLVAFRSLAVPMDKAGIAARNSELQQHADSFRDLPLATKREDMKFQKVTLNVRPVGFKGVNYDCVRFHTGSATGTFYWAFTASRRIDHWYIIPATGTLEQGFTRWDKGIATQDIEGVAKSGSEIWFQTLPVGRLKPDTTYLIWYSFSDNAPVDLAASAAIIGGPIIPSRLRYPMRKPEDAVLE